MSKNDSNKVYLDTYLRPFLDAFVVDILLEKPSDVIEFLQKWIKNKGEDFKKSTKSAKNGIKKKNSEHSDTSSSEDDYIENLPQKKANAPQKQRISVSAEAYGNFNKKGNYVPKVVPKSEEQKNRIKKRLEQSFIFSSLEDKDKEIVINAMEEKKFKTGDMVITQGEDGDTLYLVDSGELDCSKRFTKNEEPRYLKTYVPGESFGELALLYNAPRAASIKAKTDAILFALDRECFNNIVKESAVKKREKNDAFLQKVDLLSTIDPYERSQIGDALRTLKFSKGEYVVRQGDKGDNFFMVEDGNLIALKVFNESEGEKEVFKYKAGDFFGELALLNNVDRQASIKATVSFEAEKA